jgi:FkbM family methyltransferase
LVSLAPELVVIRTLVERMSRRVVLRRRWPAEFGGGHIYLSPDAMLKVWTRAAGEVDRELLQAASALVRPGNRVWDVGSNLGIFAFAAAHVAGPSGEVFAVEADTWLVNLLRRTARVRSAGARVKILPVAASGSPCIVQFNIAERGRASNFVGDGRDTTGGIRERQHMVGVSLDWLMEQAGKPDVVKIDVEGMEIEVLRGATRVLREGRPRLYIEVDQSRNAEATRILREAGYRFFRFDRGALVPEAATVWNTVAIPDEQVAEFGPRA